MIKPSLTPSQLGHVLSKTLEFQKKKINENKYPTVKVEWIKKTSDALIDTLEIETKAYNKLNLDNKVGSNDLINAIKTTLNRMLKAIGAKKKDEEEE